MKMKEFVKDEKCQFQTEYAYMDEKHSCIFLTEKTVIIVQSGIKKYFCCYHLPFKSSR
jgi:hypothetical protein